MEAVGIEVMRWGVKRRRMVRVNVCSDMVDVSMVVGFGLWLKSNGCVFKYTSHAFVQNFNVRNCMTFVHAHIVEGFCVVV